MTAIGPAGAVSSTDVQTHDAVPTAVNVWRTWLLVEHPRSRVPLLKPIAGDKRAWGPGTLLERDVRATGSTGLPSPGAPAGFTG